MDVDGPVRAALDDGTGEADVQSGPNRKARHRAGWRELILWVSGRFVMFLLIAAVGIFGLTIVDTSAGMWSASATAKVINSYEVNASDNAKPQYQLAVWVIFAPRIGGEPLEARIDPRRLSTVHLGQRLPIRYEPDDPSNAIYNGPGGDFAQENLIGYYVFVICVLLIAALFSLTGVRRLFAMLGAARSTAEMKDTDSKSNRRIRVIEETSGKAFEWRLLWSRRKFTGRVFIHGRLETGRWLVARTADNQLVWPASRAQLVVGTGMPRVPHEDATDLDVIEAHHLLLAAYAQVVKEVNTLSFLTRCPPGQSDSSWWWLGAPRPLIKALVTGQVRRRLRALGDALTCAAMLTEPDDKRAFRRTLREASQECRELAGTLRRSTLLALLIPVITIILPVYVAFFPTPHIHLTGGLASILYIAWICFGVVPILVSNNSIRCKRALFSPAIFDRAAAGSCAAAPNEWDIYRFEKEAFEQAGMSEPRELEGQSWVPWLLGAIYGVVVIVPILVIAAHSAGLAGAGRLVLLLLLYGVILTTSNVGFGRCVSSLRRFLAQVIRAPS